MSCHSYQNYLCTFSIFFELLIIHLYDFTQLRYWSQIFNWICRVLLGSNNDESELIQVEIQNIFFVFFVIHVEHLSNFYLRISLLILSFHHYYYHRIFQTLNENSCRDLTSSLKLNFEELNTDTIIRTQFTVFDKQNQIK